MSLCGPLATATVCSGCVVHRTGNIAALLIGCDERCGYLQLSVYASVLQSERVEDRVHAWLLLQPAASRT